MAKYEQNVIIILLTLFFVSQLLSLFFFSKTVVLMKEQGGENIQSSLPIESTKEPKQEFISLLISLVIAIIAFLLVMKLRLKLVWSFWYGLALLISFYFALFPFFNEVAFFIAIALLIIKIKSKNLLIYNALEILAYIGVALVISSLLNIFYATLLIIVLSIYDFIAVRKTNLMKEIASYQIKSKKLFGLILTPNLMKSNKEEINKKIVKKIDSGKIKGKESRVGILGGGDLIFPMIFLNTEFKLFYVLTASKSLAFLFTLPTVIFATLGLAYLVFFSKRKMDPALPYLTAGLLVGFLVSYNLVFETIFPLIN